MGYVGVDHTVIRTVNTTDRLIGVLCTFHFTVYIIQKCGELCGVNHTIIRTVNTTDRLIGVVCTYHFILQCISSIAKGEPGSPIR